MHNFAKKKLCRLGLFEPLSPKGERFLLRRYLVVAPQAVKTVIPAALRPMALL